MEFFGVKRPKWTLKLIYGAKKSILLPINKRSRYVARKKWNTSISKVSIIIPYPFAPHLGMHHFLQSFLGLSTNLVILFFNMIASGSMNCFSIMNVLRNTMSIRKSNMLWKWTSWKHLKRIFCKYFCGVLKHKF